MRKYKIVKEYIKSLVKKKNLGEDDKIPSEHHLAAECQVSRNTVRKAISEMTNEGYLYTRHGVGTFVNTQKQPTQNIGIVTTYIDDYIFPSVIRGMTSCFSAKNYSIILANTDNNLKKEKNILTNMLAKDIAGIIIEPSKSSFYPDNIELYNKYIQRNIPLLLIHGYHKGFDFPYLIMDDIKGGYLITEHLIKRGHRNIIGIFKNDDIQGINRSKGFLTALKDYDISIEENSLYWFHTEDRQKKPVHIIKNIIKQNKNIPTAIICYNDQIAYNIINEIKNSGLKVPEEISVTGYDDSFLAKACNPAITTIAHPKKEFGNKAAQFLLKMIDNPEKIFRKKIKPQLITRCSVATHTGR